ncbi:MAG TPA: ATPase, T2SS/T4P/T4SS family [Gemmataceae bacterium]|nr:ATPase, T2SS/T4P/T4SS family [Gemmataceae bacterium]
MDRLRRIAEFARKQKGKGIVLRGNDTCVLLGERGGRQPLNKVMSAEEVEAVLREALPPELAGRLEAGEAFSFARPTPEGELSVRVGRPGGVLEVTVALGAEPAPQPDLTAVQPAPEPPVFTPAAPAPVALPVGVTPVASVAPPVAVLPPPGSLGTARPTEARPVVEYPPDYLPGLLRVALAASASDVHLEGGSRPWARVGGEVQPLDYGRPLSADQLQAALFDLLPPEPRARWIADGSAEFCFTFEDRARVRCAVFAGARGVVASCRLLPLRAPALADLQAPAFVTELTRAERGLVLLGGVRGSGATTTLAAMVQAINTTRRARVVTAEAPVEILHRSERALVTQVEVPTHAATLPDALRRLSLADVDVCAVGDAGDPAVLQAALRLAEGGALVFAVVRQPDVPAAVEQLLECAAPASRHPGERVLRALRGVVCQRLCRPRLPGGRTVPLFEVLNVGAAAANLIRQGKPRDLHGTMFMTFDNSLAACVKEEKITREEALRQATDVENVRRLLGPGA